MKPNEHGVYSKDAAELISFATKTKTGWCSPLASAEIFILQVDDHWISALDYEFNCGDHSGCSGPMWGKYKSRNEALKPHLNSLLNFLKSKIKHGLVGCASLEQLEQAQILLTQVEQYTGAETNGQMSMFAIGE